MKYYYVIFLFYFVLSQSTFLHMDQQGVQSLAELLIQNLRDKEFQLGVDYTQNLFIGQFQLQGFNISEISPDTSQINITFNEELNLIDIDLKIDRMLLQTDIQLKLIGLTMIKERSQIEVKNSHLSLSLVLGSENQAIRVHVHKHKFNKFNIGKVHLLNGKTWYQKLMHSMASTSINLIIFGVKGTISKQLVNTIDSYGSQIPKSFPLPHPFEIAIIDFPLASNPQVIENQIKFDFLCGSDYVHHDIEQPGYIHLTMSESCINSVLRQAYKVQGVFDVSAIAQELSDIMEIDSKTLGQLFPGFWDLDHAQDVSFQINLNTEEEPEIQMEDGYALVKLPIKVDINLVEIQREKPMIRGIKVLKVNDSHGQYYASLNTTAVVNFDILKEYSGLIGNLNGIELKDLKVSDPLKMNMEAWNYQQNVALQFGRSYANQVIYGQMIKPQNYIETLSMHQIELVVEKEEIDFRMQF